MADIKMSQFQSATEVKDADLMPIVQDGINKKVLSPVLESKIIKKTTERLLAQGGISMNLINPISTVNTYSDLASITPTPNINNAYQVESDGLVYVYTENGFQTEGNGFKVQPNVDGVVEQGNTDAVSGGEVFDAQLSERDLNKVKKVFPYDVTVTNIDVIKPFTNALLDIIITNKREGFVYSVGHIEVNVSTGLRELRIYRSSDNGITNSLILRKSYYITGVDAYTGSGIEYTDDNIITGGVVYENIKLCIDVFELFKNTTSKINVYANNYPLSPLVFTNGIGIIQSKVNNNSINSVIVSSWKMFPYGTPINDNTTYINNALKSITVYGYNPNRFYFLSSIVNRDDLLEILIQSSSDEGRTTNILNACRLRITQRDKGVKSYIANGSNFASKVEIVINWDFLNLNIGKHAIVEEVVKMLPTLINLSSAVKEGQILALKDIDYLSEIGFDNCILKKGINPTFGLNEFHLLKNDNTYSRINTNGSTIIQEDGDYTISLALYQPNTSNPALDSINYYLSDVKFPNLPPSLPTSLNLEYAEEGIIDYKHPEIVDLESNPIGGYRYWLTTSTHPYQSDIYEDESIYVSNDFTNWLRVRAYNEDYIEGIHAVGIAMPPQSFITSKSDFSWNQFLPIPKVGSTIIVNGVSKTISERLKHDPMFTYNREDGSLYWILTYNFKFTDDTQGEVAAESNKFNICIKTTNGVNYYLVRSDGSTILLDTPIKTDLFFTQSDGKNNYIRWIDHGQNEIGGSLVYYQNEWWCFGGRNGSLIYKNNQVYNVYQSSPITSQQDDFNHPTHFVYDNQIYRWGSKGISVMGVDYKFTLLPINSMFAGYKGDENQYKKCLYINSLGEGIWAVSENQEGYKSIWNMSNSFALGKRGQLTIGKVNVAQMISATQVLKKGYYVSIEVFVSEIGKVKKYRVPFLNKGNYNNSHPVTKHNLITLKLIKGQEVSIDSTIIAYGTLNIGVSDVILVK